jgi:hypothetical protein
MQYYTEHIYSNDNNFIYGILNKIEDDYFIEVNTMNLSKQIGDKELFTGTIVEENTMNLSKQIGDKELFSGTILEENTIIFI